MDENKFNQVLDYFASYGINLPTDVKNSIEDVFRENDDIESVQCYHFAEVEDFQRDLKLTNSIKLYLSGNNSGKIFNVWTYHGQVQFSLSEHVILYRKPEEDPSNEEVVEVITDLNNDEVSFVYNAKEYSVILLETVSWDSPEKLERHLELMIYCPEDIVEEE